MNRAPRSPNQLKSEDAFFKILVDNGSFDLSCTKSTDVRWRYSVSCFCAYEIARPQKFHVSSDMMHENREREREGEILVVGREDIDNHFSIFGVAGNDSREPQES